MTTVWKELATSRGGHSTRSIEGTRTYLYRCTGSDDLATMAAELNALAPAAILCPFTAVLMLRADVRFNRIGQSGSGGPVWDFSVEYEDPESCDKRDQLDTGDSTFSFSTTGGTATLTTSLETVTSYAPPAKTAPDFKQALNVTPHGKPQGVQVIVPALKFTIRYRQPLATITNAYVCTLEAMTGTTNDDTFFSRLAGEVLFAGASGSQGTNSDPTIEYEFLRLPNVVGQTIGDIININKKGHEYLWVLFQEYEDTTADYTAAKPIAVYVERLYPESDFAALGIGT